MTDLEARFRDQARMCRQYGSALTGALLEGAADDLAVGGVVADLMAPHLGEPSGSVLSLRFAGALHRLVLEGRAPELALHYPSVGGTAPVEDVWPVARETCLAQLDVLRPLVARPVQTNEVGRSAVLYGVLQLLQGPFRLLELGSSAGLNLRCDAFAYEVGGEVLGDPASAVRLVEPWEGHVPAYRGEPEVLERKGCDPNRVDAGTEEGRLALASYVWGDQVERLARLRAAFDVARAVPAMVERAGALEFLRRELRPVEGVTTVVWHSIVWQYIEPVERAALDELLATSEVPLVHASMEPERIGGGEYAFQVHLQRPGGERVHVADANGHGPPVCWTGATMEP